MFWVSFYEIPKLPSAKRRVLTFVLIVLVYKFPLALTFIWNLVEEAKIQKLKDFEVD